MKSSQVVVVVLALTCGFLVGPSAAQRAPRIVRVPQDVRTIQAAINLVADGGKVIAQPGTYFENITIVGKRVTLVGNGREGTRRTVIAGARGRGALIFYGPGGTGDLVNLTLSGGDVGVRSEGIRRPSEIVRIDDVSLQRNGRGVYGSFGRLVVSQTSIFGSLIHAMSVICVHKLEFSEAILAGASQWGLVKSTCPLMPGSVSVVIDDSVFSSNLEGGAAFLGKMKVTITDSEFSLNKSAALFFNGTEDVTLINTSADSTAVGEDLVNVGWGIVTLDAGIVRVFFSQALANATGGVGSFGDTEVRLAGTDVTANRFGRVSGDGSPCPAILDLGNNFLTGNIEQDLFDGCLDLSVPQPPPVPEE